MDSSHPDLSRPRNSIVANRLVCAIVPKLILLIPMLATALGGLLALRFRRHADALTALGAGLMLGAAFLDLLPEGLQLGLHIGLSLADLLALTLLFFLLFYAADLLLSALETRVRRTHSGLWVRRTGLALFVFHSFRDGMAIGAAYAASHPAGYAVACGIAAHDIGDGMNTVLLTTQGRSARRGDILWLAADALAPVLGGLLTFWWFVSSRGSVVLLLLAAAFFLQVATGEFLQHVRTSARSRAYVLLWIAVGSLLIYGANRLIGVR